jgi:hypothetical protein
MGGFSGSGVYRGSVPIEVLHEFRAVSTYPKFMTKETVTRTTNDNFWTYFLNKGKSMHRF